ncbi:MAG: hypothetical protein H6636_11260 [Anaerolineales bacterium]|nr:hypothetical protein [Anaerolineales bacterium]
MNFPPSTPIGEVCVPNINFKERQIRLRFGLISLVFALLVLTVLTVTNVNLWWRLLLFPLFAGSATGYFQWRDKT